MQLEIPPQNYPTPHTGTQKAEKVKLKRVGPVTGRVPCKRNRGNGTLGITTSVRVKELPDASVPANDVPRHRGVNVARGDRLKRDPLRRVLERQVGRERRDERLGGAVERDERHWVGPGDGGQVDHCPAAAGDHPGDDQVRHGDHGVVVDLKHLSVLIFRHFNEVRIPGTKKRKSSQ